MRQIFLEKGIVAVKEVCEPILEENHILVEVHYSCISPGTENSTIMQNRSTNNFFSNIPSKLTKILQSLSANGIESTKALIREKLGGVIQMLGYSCSGKVVAVGKKITKIRVGDLVACAGAGYANHAEFICVPENLVVRINDERYLKEASTTTLGAIALQGIRRAQLQIGETVAIIGLGLLGQLSIQLAKLSGLRVIGIDLIHARLEMAKSLGADYIIHPTEQELIKEINALTHHYSVDCTIITAASASSDIVQSAMEITRKKGRVVVVGDVGLSLERSPFYQKEIDFLISCSYGPGRYDNTYEQQGIDYPYPYVRWTENRNMQAFLSLIEQKRINIEPLITQSLVLDEVTSAYEQLKERKSLAIIINYSSQQNLIADAETDTKFGKNTQKNITFIPAVKDMLRVGVVGAGGFAKVKLLPILSKIKNVKINAIVDANIATSQSVSKIYAAKKALNDHALLFQDDLIDVALIASPHKYHCEQALRALTHGKAVFLEKPMAINFEQLETLNTFLTEHPTIPFCVDYNRSFAPFIIKIKEQLEKRQSPIMIYYRMNAGFIPKDHWIQTEVGAGRIIGEACHIFDLFYYLTDSRPVAVSVESLKPAHDDLFPTDNFSAQISFADGSVCTLLYTSIGNSQLPKEYMELYYDSKTIIMDDYKTLTGYGLPRSFNEKTNTPDKGHEYLIKYFFNTIKQSDTTRPIPLNRLYDVARLTLIVDQLACKGGGIKELSR